jgi:aryl-alcohol dehydrogenase-like predicted oxidoreductase
MPQLAIGFAGTHPAVTSVILGPRTQEQLDGLLTAADLTLSSDVLDRIDEIVPSGTDLAYDMYRATPPAIAEKELRRR